MKKVVFLTLCLVLKVSFGFTQTIYKDWFSEEFDICMKIQRKGYSIIGKAEFIKLKQKKKKLIIYDYTDPDSKYTKKYKAMIISLTENKLIIRFCSKKNYLGLPSGKNLEFDLLEGNCEVRH